MKITDLTTISFRYTARVVRDSHGHNHPGEAHEAAQTLLRIATDEGVEGYATCSNPAFTRRVLRPLLVGEDPLYRERIWQHLKQRQRLHIGTLSDRVLSEIDLALWDLAGRYFNQPVYKLLGGFRDMVPAYASTMCGDDLPGGLDTPEAYARFALQGKERGYTAFKLHTWQPPITGAPDPKRDAAACQAVRDAVGPDMALMLDPYHNYTREQSRYLGKQLEKASFYWMEEPMDEHNTSSYAWLTRELDLPIVGPETAGGQLATRAEWIVRGAADMSRGGVADVGGITPLMKLAHLCEAFGVQMEVHGGGAANLHALCAMGIPGEYYERGLLHPFIDYEQPAPWLNALPDPMDGQGFVHVSQKPGLGWDFNFDYIRDNQIKSDE